MAMSGKAILFVVVLGVCVVLPVGAVRGADAPQPAAKVVYQSDFAKGVGNEWWPRRTDVTPAGNRTFLGQFGIEPATLTLNELPSHKFLRIKITLFMLETMDGSSPVFGVCPWEMRVLDGGPRLIYATFDNCCFFSDNNEQSFPDDFPYGVHKGWTGTAEKQTLGYVRPFHDGTRPEDCSSVYEMTLVFPHEDKNLRLLLHALWGKTQKKWGAAWGLEKMTVEALDGPVPLSDRQMENLWGELAGQDAAQAFKAIWQFVGAGDQAVEFIRSKIGKPVLPRQEDPQPEDEVGRLVKNLDDPSFQVRQEATRRLIEVGRPALARLQEMARVSASPEIRFRLQEIIKKLEAQAAPPEQQVPLRMKLDLLPLRAVRALETIGGAKALAALDAIAKGNEDQFAPLAQGARQRLAERMFDHLLAQADAAGKAGDAKAVSAFLGQAEKMTKDVPAAADEGTRVVSALKESAAREKIRAADTNVAGAEARREAMAMWLTVGQDPVGAAKLADDPKDREALALAAKPIEDLTGEQTAALRAFCLKAAKGADGKVFPGMVARALAAAQPDPKPTEEGFNPAKDLPRDLMKALMVDQATRGQWADLVPVLDIPAIEKGNHIVPENAWRMQWNGAKAGGQTPYLCLPVQAPESYQLRLTMQVCRSKWNVSVPVGDRHIEFIMDWQGKVYREVGGQVSGAAPFQWAVRDGMAIDEVRMDVTVRQEVGGTAAVTVRFDGRDVGIDWKGKVADLSKGKPGDPPAGCPGVGLGGSWGLVREAFIRPLGGGKITFDAVKQPEGNALPVPPPDIADPPPDIGVIEIFD
jgi:hypothetical protein